MASASRPKEEPYTQQPKCDPNHKALRDWTTHEKFLMMQCYEFPTKNKQFSNIAPIDLMYEIISTKTPREIRAACAYYQSIAFERMRRQAEEAKRQAEEVKRQAEGAKKEAEAAKKQAEGAKKPAEAAKRPAEVAKRPAEVAKKQAEAAKKQPEGAKKPAEAAKRPAEVSKRPAEVAKKQAEATKRLAETAKRSAEVVKKQAEATKRPAETAKRPAEGAKKQAEATKRPAEAAKRQTEAAKNEKQKNLSEWENKIKTQNPELKKTETATALRMIADLEEIPPKELTEGIDFRQVYHQLANALEGKLIVADAGVKAVLKAAYNDTAAKAKENKNNPPMKDFVRKLNTGENFVQEKFPGRPTEDRELQVLRHLSDQEAYNPLEIPEERLKMPYKKAPSFTAKLTHLKNPVIKVSKKPRN